MSLAAKPMKILLFSILPSMRKLLYKYSNTF